MRINSSKLKWKLAQYRALIGFYLVAMAQFLSPAAAADPASKIDPPSWSHSHSQQELQAYAARGQTQEPETKQTMRRAVLNQRLKRNP